MGSSSPTAMLWRASLTCGGGGVTHAIIVVSMIIAMLAAVIFLLRIGIHIAIAVAISNIAVITISFWSCVGISRGATLSAASLYLHKKQPFQPKNACKKNC
jgi:hypothetical protein